MRNLVTKHGITTAVIYQEIRDLIDDSTHEPTSAALRRVLLAVLCGWPWERLLRSVPSHPSTDDAMARLVTMVELDQLPSPDERARRRAARFSAAYAVPDAELTVFPERLVHMWLYRYVEVYGVGPTIAEIRQGIAVRTLKIEQCLMYLERHGAAVNLGGPREWLPTRGP